MLLDDIVALLREVSRNAHVVDDERVDDRIWEDFIMLKRNTWIKNYFNEKGTIEQNTLQFEILDVTAYDAVQGIAGASLGTKILRSDVCPTLIEGRSGVAIYEITSADPLSRTIQSVSMDRLRWCGNGVTNKNTIFAAFYDGRFYLKSNSEIQKPIQKIRVVGVFADPLQVSTFDRDTDDYPVNDYMVNYMKNSVFTEDFGMLMQGRSDKVNDSSGDINGETQKVQS